MAKENKLVISGELKLPADYLDAAEKVSGARGIIREAEQKLKDALGPEFALTARVMPISTYKRKKADGNGEAATRRGRPASGQAGAAAHSAAA